MAGEDLSAGLINAMDESGTTDSSTEASTEPSAEQPPGGSYDTNGLSPYAQNWLAQLPENERPKASEYVRNWDQGFQQHSQRINQQLQPYTQLGSAEELAQIKNIIEQLKTDPQGFVDVLVQNGFYKPAGQQPQQQAPQYFDADGNPVQVQQPGLPPEVGTKLTRLETAFGAMAQQVAAQQNAREQAEADRQLDQIMTEAKNKHGQFNELYVLQLMANQGLSIDAAVQSWKNEIQAAVAAQNRPPANMSASSAPPAAPGPLNSSEDRATALATMLGQLKQQ
jgi:hypothetical protein